MKARIGIGTMLVTLLAVSVFALTGCGSSTTGTTGGETSATTEAPAQEGGALNVAGSDTMVNLSQAWAEAYAEVNPNAMVTVKGGGSGNGIAALINKTVEIANSSREIKEEEVTQAEAAGVTPVSTEVARDGLAVIVNTANKVADISKDDLGKVYRGEITNWKELGGADAPIVLLGRDSSSGTYGFVQDEVVGKDKLYAKSMRNMQSTQAIVDETAKNPNAIGYVGLGYESASVKPLTVDGVASTVETVLDASYPLSRPLIMISNGEPTGLAAAYLQWILGPDGQKIVADQGFVPLTQ
ncbi:MAG: PstS family phosphate ABC transporter substrate-binding protein [Coriobacteriia bacterium]|nr:PstS family phosphate ABC transporter substrate-binding protein [Coriobacteriia bacterium]